MRILGQPHGDFCNLERLVGAWRPAAIAYPGVPAGAGTPGSAQKLNLACSRMTRKS